MWDIVKLKFDKYPAQEKVAEKMMEYGISVRDGFLYSGEIFMPGTALARVSGTDRRVVLATVQTIMDDPELAEIFSKLSPICSFKDVAPAMKWSVLEVMPENIARPGIVAEVTQILARENISLRQIIADDPGIHKDPKAIFISEDPIPSRLLPEIKELVGVKGVAIY